MTENIVVDLGVKDERRYKLKAVGRRACVTHL
jgi:hypothetical protein